MRTKIQLKLNSDILLTVIQILEQTVDYPVETINDALLVSVREDLIDKLIDKSKTIQKQVSILDHAKKHLVVLKYHEAYCLYLIVDSICATGAFDENASIKKVRRLLTELEHKIEVTTDLSNTNTDETNSEFEKDSTTSDLESIEAIGESKIELNPNKTVNLFDHTDEAIAESNPIEDNSTKELQYDTFAYPLEDNWNIQLTDLVYSLAIEDNNALVISEETIEPLTSDEVVTTAVEETTEPIEIEVTEEGIAETTEPVVLEENIEIEATEEGIAETTEPVVLEENIEIEATEEGIAETTEPIVLEENIEIEATEEGIAETTEPIVLEENTEIEATENIVLENTIFEEINTTIFTSFEDQLLAEQQDTDSAENQEIDLIFNIEEEPKKAKKVKVKKETKASADLGQMSLF